MFAQCQNPVFELNPRCLINQPRAANHSTAALIEGLFGVLRAHPQERAATLPLAEARMDERTRRETFRYVLRKSIALILRARSPTLSAERARDRAIVLLQLMKAASALNDEEGLSGRSTALRELQSLAAQYLEQR